MMPLTIPLRTGVSAAVVLLLALAASLPAVDREPLRGERMRDTDHHAFAIVPQIMVGTAGVEPGFAVEYRPAFAHRLMIRPEIFLNQDGDVGGGASALFSFSDLFDLPSRQAIYLGPRYVHHNHDNNGWELDLFGVWAYDLAINGARDRHFIEGLAAAGVLEDRDDSEYRLGLSVGVGYRLQF